MPLSQDPGKREDERYCSYCFVGGKFCYEGDLKGFKRVCYEGMRKHGMGALKAWFFAQMVSFAPRWKK